MPLTSSVLKSKHPSARIFLLSSRHFRRPFPTPRCFSHPARSYASATSDSTISNPSSENQDPFTYCRDFVQKHDRDAYLVSQFFPKHLQNACFAVRAFYIELAMIPDVVSNTVIGQMRMQFWKEALKSIFEEQPTRPPHHPIALALNEASQIAHITPYHLKRIAEARDNDLKSPVYMTMDSLTAHAEATSSTLNYLLLSILNLSSSETLFHAASHVGIAQTIATLLRALPYHASKRRMVIPASITAQHQVSQEDVFLRGDGAANITDAVYDFAVVANDHLITAREMFRATNGRLDVPIEAMPVFLGAIPTTNYLRRLEAADFNAFEPKLQLRDSFKLPWAIYWGHRRRSF